MMIPMVSDDKSSMLAVLDSQRVEKFSAVVERRCFVVRPSCGVVCGYEVEQALRIVFVLQQVCNVPFAAGHDGLHNGCRCDDVAVFVFDRIAENVEDVIAAGIGLKAAADSVAEFFEFCGQG